MPLTGKTREEILELEKKLSNAVPENGASIGNKTLREKLNWEPDLYLAIRSRLIEDSQVTLGKGRGGSVRRIPKLEKVEVQELAEDTSFEDNTPYSSEQSLYAPLIDVIRERWVKEQPFDNFIVEDTSQGGRRSDGIWARPDITVVANTTYTYVPGRHFDVVTFEVKHYKNLNVTAVYEALAHRRSATRSFLLVYVPDDELQTFEDSTLSEIVDEAARHGIGFIVAGDPTDFDTWDIREDDQPITPDPARLNKFVRNQLSEGTRDEIVRWFR